MRRLKFNSLLGLMLVSPFLGGCDQDDSNTMLNNIDKLLVVEGYVYAGEPIKHIKLSKIHSGGSYIPVPVHNAEVRVMQGDFTFHLMAHDSILGMYQQEGNDNELPVNYGNLDLEVKYGEQTFTSRTAMPPMMHGLAASENYILLNQSSSTAVLSHLTWDDIHDGPYCIFIRNMDDLQPTEQEASSSSENPFLQVVHTNSAQLKAAHFSHYGTYEIYVSAVNAEYADLYNAGSRLTMTAAPSNINNGFGVFTAFNGQAITITVE